MNNMLQAILSKISLLLFYVISAIFICISHSTASPSPDIILYGNEKYSYCRDTMQWLETQHITYIYLDVERYGTNQEEMFLKLDRAGFKATAHFPVLDVKGQILMKPKFDDIKKALAGEKITYSAEKKVREPKWRPERKKSLTTDFKAIKNKIGEQDIIFYDDGSGSGKRLLNLMNKERIPFTLKQLNRLTNAAYFDMSTKLSALGYGNITFFPVIEIRGEMIMNPSIEEVKILAIEMIAD